MSVPIHTRDEVSSTLVDELMKGGEPATLAATDWLEDVRSEKALNAIYAAFEKRHREALKALTAIVGKPDLDLEAVNAFVPEALAAAGWTRGDRVLVLAVLHHDQETPVILQLWSLTRDEITQLSE